MYPGKPFATRDEAWAWVERFVHCYNHEHLHSAIGFVSPDHRRHGRDIAVLNARHDVYARARDAHPERWSGKTREWDAPAIVALNPREQETKERAANTWRIGERAAFFGDSPNVFR